MRAETNDDPDRCSESTRSEQRAAEHVEKSLSSQYWALLKPGGAVAVDTDPPPRPSYLRRNN